jgi:hypothetical protein
MNLTYYTHTHTQFVFKRARSFIMLKFNKSGSITHPIMSKLCQTNFKIVQLGPSGLEIVRLNETEGPI